MGFGGGEAAVAEHQRQQALGEAKRYFRPELLGRMDEVVVFSALSEPDMARIAEQMLGNWNSAPKKRLPAAPQPGAAGRAGKEKAPGLWRAGAAPPGKPGGGTGPGRQHCQAAAPSPDRALPPVCGRARWCWRSGDTAQMDPATV